MKQDLPILLIVEPGRAAPPWAASLRNGGFAVSWARDAKAARAILGETKVEGMITRLRAPGIDGRALLERARALHPTATVVLLAESIDADVAAGLIAAGAEDVQAAPPHAERLLAVLRRGLGHARSARRVAELEQTIDRRYRSDPLTGTSAATRRVVDQIHRVAATRAMVLIEGESGTGKARVARAIHHDSPRRDGPFERVSLGAVPESQMEREIFGEPGDEIARGTFDEADGGTLFLDEIDRAPASVQLRLLGVIRGRGAGNAPARRADVRILASTDQDLSARVRAGRFRADLLERLGAVRITLPPLRERLEDIPLLVERFLRDFNRAHGRRVGGITRGALDALAAYAWPGNVDELRNQVEAMVIAAHGRRRLDLTDLPTALRRESPSSQPSRLAPGMTVEEAERQLIEATLRHTEGNKPRAAEMLGIGLRTLYRKIRQYRLA